MAIGESRRPTIEDWLSISSATFGEVLEVEEARLFRLCFFLCIAGIHCVCSFAGEMRAVGKRGMQCMKCRKTNTGQSGTVKPVARKPTLDTDSLTEANEPDAFSKMVKLPRYVLETRNRGGTKFFLKGHSLTA